MKGIIKTAPINKEDIKESMFGVIKGKIVQVKDSFRGRPASDFFGYDYLEQIVIEYEDFAGRTSAFDSWTKQIPLQQSDWKKALEIGINEEVDFAIEYEAGIPKKEAQLYEYYYHTKPASKPILYTEEEVKKLCDDAAFLFVKRYSPELHKDFDYWWEQNKKK